jgi:hypothetical protein
MRYDGWAPLPQLSHSVIPDVVFGSDTLVLPDLNMDLLRPLVGPGAERLFSALVIS